MNLEEFKQSANGRKLEPLLRDPAVIGEMLRLSRQGRPAVMAIDTDVAERIGALDNVEKQHVGRWVRDTLAQHGMTSVHQLSFRGGRVFTSGMVYRPIARPSPPAAPVTEASAADRVAPPPAMPAAVQQARAILAAGRRNPEAPLDTVEAFIHDRRAAWGQA